MMRVAVVLLIGACAVLEASAKSCQICQVGKALGQVDITPGCGFRECPSDGDQVCASFDATVSVSGIDAEVLIRDCIQSDVCDLLEQNPGLIEMAMAANMPDNFEIGKTDLRCCSGENCNAIEGLRR